MEPGPAQEPRVARAVRRVATLVVATSAAYFWATNLADEDLWNHVNFGEQKLRENAWTLLELLQKLKPSSAKGAYMKSIVVSTTMGPGIKIDPNEVAAAFATK